jgi:putative metal-binding protein
MHRSRRLTVAGVVLWGAAAAMPALAEPPNATQKSGEIRGRVTYCAPGSATGAVAHLPGKSFEARLGPTGGFQLYWVPVGRHTVAIDAPGRATHTIEDVVVLDRRVTDMGEISVCRDADGDSSNENVDCNDNNPNIRPGVQESCDGFDNNCDGVVDEGCAICTDADHDGFFAQSGCGSAVDCNDNAATTRPGAAEVCDALDNNCDAVTDEGFDLSSDPSNCGACGNVCAARGPELPAACSAGACLPEPETCDSVDNDLDGEVDEGFDLQTDASNCGACGIVCSPRGPGLPAACSAGACLPPPPEICDYQDNDLDGLVDEGFNLGLLCPISCFDPDIGPYRGTRVCSEDGVGTVCEC